VEAAVTRRRDPTSARAHGYGPNHGGHMIRQQERAGNGQWRRNASLNAGVCQNEAGECYALLLPRPPWHPDGPGYPDVCPRCGAVQVHETCTHGGCEDGFPDPFVMNSGGYHECGERAVAFDLLERRSRCAAHLDATPARRLEDVLRALPEGVLVRFVDGAPRSVAGALAELDDEDRDFPVWEHRTERRWTISVGTGEVAFTVLESAP
jgi:hypothetical protein